MTSSAVVGSSAMSSFGLAGERHGDHRPLPHAARKFVRILPGAALGVRHLHRSSMSTAPAGRAPAECCAGAKDLGNLLADRQGRVSAVIGSWKIIGIGLPRSLRISPILEREQVGHRRAGSCPPRNLERFTGRSRMQRERGHRLAAAALADQAQRLAGTPERLISETDGEGPILAEKVDIQVR